MERHNRKSHLAPQLSPSTQALLRGDPVSSPSKESTTSKTPTSGEIPIAGDEVKSTNIPSEQPAIQRIYSADVNGTGMYPTQTSNYSGQMFPPRTSSTFPRDNEGHNHLTAVQGRQKENETFNLPIRPAPPPSGPLPQPPAGPLPQPPTSSLRYPGSRRQGTNGLSYGNNEGSHF